MKNKFFLFYIIFSNIYFVNYHFESVYAEASCKTSIIQDGKTETKFNNNTEVSGGDIRWISNIYHSFSSFDIGSESIIEIASNTSGISSVIIEVTGTAPSNICGTLTSTIQNAKIYLINPNGVFFGPDYQLNIDGTLHVITSESLVMKQTVSSNITSNELKTLIKILQALSGMNISPGIEFDLHSDNKTALEECIYWLQHISGLDTDSFPAYPFSSNKYIDYSHYQTTNEPKKYTDTDFDNIDDNFEKKLFGNLNQSANDDFDHDGFSNIIEYNWTIGRQNAKLQQKIESATFKALEWLGSNQNNDGSWGVQTKPLNTSEAVIALQSVNHLASSYYQGVSWLESHNFSNTDYKARRIIALRINDNSIINDFNSILSIYDNSKGWGLSKFYFRSKYDTCLALQSVASQSTNFDHLPAIEFLKSSINSHDNSIVISCAVQTLLSHHQTETSINAFVSLLNDKNLFYASLITKANAAIAFYNSQSFLDKADELFESILSEQKENGSWMDDSYTTSLVILTISAKTKIQQNIEHCKIVDEQLQAAINFSLGKTAYEPVTTRDILRLRYLNASKFNITDLSGLEKANNLEFVDLRNNQSIKNLFEILNQLPNLKLSQSGITLMKD
jgi:filamentous hemagglutinin family protein